MFCGKGEALPSPEPINHRLSIDNPSKQNYLHQIFCPDRIELPIILHELKEELSRRFSLVIVCFLECSVGGVLKPPNDVFKPNSVGRTLALRVYSPELRVYISVCIGVVHIKVPTFEDVASRYVFPALSIVPLDGFIIRQSSDKIIASVKCR